ncbi:MAG: hypothetical protein NXH75_11265, partial [Halobacteriovoraceae bacterium]|nr:hypothetical protein [Halobacteriovoraceae bacterium]
DTLQSFMHKVETQFESLRVGQSISQEQIDYFLMAIDGARTLLESGDTTFGPDSFQQFSSEEKVVVQEDEKIEEIKKVAEDRVERQESHKKGLVYVVDKEKKA